MKRKIRNYIETCDEGFDGIYYNLDKVLTAIKNFQKFLEAIGGMIKSENYFPAKTPAPLIFHIQGRVEV